MGERLRRGREEAEQSHQRLPDPFIATTRSVPRAQLYSLLPLGRSDRIISPRASDYTRKLKTGVDWRQTGGSWSPQKLRQQKSEH